MKLPYASSTAGAGREREIRDMLREAGAGAIGFMVDDDRDLVIAQFRLAGREITVPVSVAAYEAAWMHANPCGPRTEPQAWRRKARTQAEIAVWAVLADWIKAQVAMIACGFATPEEAFLAHIHAPDGRRLVEVIRDKGGRLLPPPPGKEG